MRTLDGHRYPWLLGGGPGMIRKLLIKGHFTGAMPACVGEDAEGFAVCEGLDKSCHGAWWRVVGFRKMAIYAESLRDTLDLKQGRAIVRLDYKKLRLIAADGAVLL